MSYSHSTENAEGAMSLPELPYTLRTRKKSIAISWFVIWFFSSGLIEILYFSLRYGGNVDPNIAIAVTVATLGAFSVFNIGMRIYKLVRPKDPWRPANTKPWFLDFFMINYLVIFVLVTIVISSATTDPPKIRQASMPQAVVLYFVSIEILLCDLFAYLGLKTPFRFSSTEKGADIPPASLIIIEDVVAVDGAGGVEFREALQLRYSASPQFRRLLWQMDLFWATGGLLIAIAVTLIIFLCSNEIVGFAVGWVVPFAWAAVWAAMTIPWVQRGLAKEQEAFVVASKSMIV